ncbi:RNA polymerase sigma factor [Streptomyces sioyaensis]|uniref:RNA polymerase sigma factor n=1 Tax=Streptomyces sioyaensis TaxID=67364 RepID=UPI003721D511
MADRGWASERLIGAAQRGDVESINALVYDAHPHVQRFAHSLCASPQDAEDAAQEALIILYRKIGSLRATGALASWMFRIVRNECLRRAQLMARRREQSTVAEMLPLEDEVLQRLEAERVARAIGDLPELQRRVLIMRDVQGHPGRTVAHTLGLSVAAMKSQLHRARTAVRLALHNGSDARPGDAG